MDVLPESLDKKAGPFPLWVWGAGIGLLVVVVWYMRSRVSASSPAPVASGVTDPMAFDNAGLYSGNNANAANATQATNSTPGTARTNAAWMRQALVYETGRKKNAITVQRALSKYLAGTQLSQTQADIVADVLKHVGLPPNPPKKIPPVKHEPDPHKPHPPVHKDVLSQNGLDAPPAMGVSASATPIYTHHTAADGDTPASVAQTVYGTSTPYHVETIRRANGLGSTDQFVGGQTVRVPYHG